MSERSEETLFGRQCAGLRALLESTAPGQILPVPVDLLRELLARAGAESGALVPDDPTAEELSQHFGKSAATIRQWCAAGRFPGAYKRDGSWHVPTAGVEAMRQAGRSQGRGKPTWRDIRRVS